MKRGVVKRSTIAVVCLAAVAVGAAGYFYGRRAAAWANSSKPQAAPSLISLLPPQAPYLIYADVAELRASAFLTQLVAMVPAPSEDPEYSKFVSATGFDYTRDLDRVAIAVVPTAPQPIVWTIAEGRFDQQKITAYALGTGAAEQRNGRTVYAMPASTPGENVTLSFLAPNRIQLITRPADSPAVVPSPTNADAGMSNVISRVAGSAFFAVARTDSLPKNLTLGSLPLSQYADALRGVRWLSLAGAPDGENLRIVIEGQCDTSANALQLEFVLQGLRMLGTSQSGRDSMRKQFTPEVAGALFQLMDKAEVSHSDQSVRLTIVFTPDILHALAASSTQQSQPPAQAPAHPAKPPAAPRQ